MKFKMQKIARPTPLAEKQPVNHSQQSQLPSEPGLKLTIPLASPNPDKRVAFAWSAQAAQGV